MAWAARLRGRSPPQLSRVPDGLAAAGRDRAGAAKGGECGLAAVPAKMGEAHDDWAALTGPTPYGWSGAHGAALIRKPRNSATIRLDRRAHRSKGAPLEGRTAVRLRLMRDTMALLDVLQGSMPQADAL